MSQKEIELVLTHLESILEMIDQINYKDEFTNKELARMIYDRITFIGKE